MQKTFVHFLSVLFPGLMVKLAYQQLSNPQIHKTRPHEVAIQDKAVKERIDFQGFDIQLYTWGTGSKKILLIHGWEGQAGNFADLIERLLEEDYTIHAFDGPSHGLSSKGPTSLFEFSDLVGYMIERFEPAQLVSHSFGGVATSLSLSVRPQIEIDKYVMLTTPDRFLQRIKDVSDRVGITDKVRIRLTEKLEEELDIDASKMNVSDFIQKASVGKSLIIHDKNDRIIPLHQSENVHKNWPQSELRVIEGTGHFRILRTESVIEQVVDFLKN